MRDEQCDRHHGQDNGGDDDEGYLASPPIASSHVDEGNTWTGIGAVVVMASAEPAVVVVTTAEAAVMASAEPATVM